MRIADQYTHTHTQWSSMQGHKAKEKDGPTTTMIMMIIISHNHKGQPLTPLTTNEWGGGHMREDIITSFD